MMLRSPDEKQREMSASALRAFRDPRAVAALIDALNDSEDEVVEQAAKSLGFIGDPVAVLPLMSKLNHNDSSVRGASAEALGNIGDPRAIPALENVLATDWNPFLKGVVNDALTKCRLNTGKVVYEERVVVDQYAQPAIAPAQAIAPPAPAPAFSQTLQPPDQPVAKIAVLSFRDTTTSGANYGDALSEMITTAFIKSRYFYVIERSQIQKIMEEQQFSVSGSVDSDTAIELGRILGVEYLIVGSVARLGSLFEIDIRFIETKSGKGLIAESASCRGEEGLRPTLNKVTDNIIKRYDIMFRSE
jgi:TolB-like protein